MAEQKETPDKKIVIPDLSKLDFQSFPKTRPEELFFDRSTDREKPGVEGNTKMVWMNESAVVTPESETPVVGTRSLADCLGIGVSGDHVAGADHMRFDPTHDIEGDNIGYAYGRMVHLVREVLEKSKNQPVNLYLVNIAPPIRGEERNNRLRRVLEDALKDERIADKVKNIEWIDQTEGFKIDSRTGDFSKF